MGIPEWDQQQIYFSLEEEDKGKTASWLPLCLCTSSEPATRNRNARWLEMHGCGHWGFTSL